MASSTPIPTVCLTRPRMRYQTIYSDHLSQTCQTRQGTSNSRTHRYHHMRRSFWGQRSRCGTGKHYGCVHDRQLVAVCWWVKLDNVLVVQNAFCCRLGRFVSDAAAHAMMQSFVLTRKSCSASSTRLSTLRIESFADLPQICPHNDKPCISIARRRRRCSILRDVLSEGCSRYEWKSYSSRTSVRCETLLGPIRLMCFVLKWFMISRHWATVKCMRFCLFR